MSDPPPSTKAPGPWDILPHGLGNISKLFPITKSVPKATNKLAAPEPSSGIKTSDPVAADLLVDPKTEPIEQRTRLEVDGDHKEVKSEEPKNGIDASLDVINKVQDLVDSDEKLQKNNKKSKNRYGVDHQNSPFPDHAMPTIQDCEEVHRLLTSKHGKVTQPTTIPRPSSEVTGCGEVPDLIDSLLRTLLSAATTSNNSNRAFQSLKDTFGLKNDTANWEAVHKADLGKVIDSIKCGGLAVVKGNNIKKILDIVYKKNCDRRDAILEERKTGLAANILGLEDLTKEQKDAELARLAENPLSLDWILDLKEDWQAMDELVKLPGIGIKTASCVLLFRLQRPSFAVDTHVWRHCKWLGWVPPKATRDQTFNHCNLRVPDELKYSLHQLFIAHGKNCYRCRANTSAGTAEWDKAECPIEHLVNRAEKRKQLGGGPSGGEVESVNVKGIKARKRKVADDTDGSEFEVSTTKSTKSTKIPPRKKVTKTMQLKTESTKKERPNGGRFANGSKTATASSKIRNKKRNNADDIELGAAVDKPARGSKRLARKQPLKPKISKADSKKLPLDDVDIGMTEEEIPEEGEDSSYEATEDEGSEYHD